METWALLFRVFNTPFYEGRDCYETNYGGSIDDYRFCDCCDHRSGNPID